MNVKTFKTREELMKFISTNTLPNAAVSIARLSVTYAGEEIKEKVAEPEPKGEDQALIDARINYTATTGKPVPNNKKNDVEWLKAQVEEK